MQAAREQRIDTLQAALDKVRGFLRRGQYKTGRKGRIKQSNLTDPDSAKMKGSKGTIQGYSGMALVDAKHQVVVHAEAVGEAAENGLLVPVLEGVRENYRELELSEDVLEGVKLLGDAGVHSEKQPEVHGRARH